MFFQTSTEIQIVYVICTFNILEPNVWKRTLKSAVLVARALSWNPLPKQSIAFNCGYKMLESIFKKCICCISCTVIYWFSTVLNNNNLTHKNKSPEGRNRTHQKNTQIFNHLSFNTKMLQKAKFPSLDYLSWTGRKMQNRGLIDGWIETGGINRSDFWSWILAGIFLNGVLWMAVSQKVGVSVFLDVWYWRHFHTSRKKQGGKTCQ